MSADKRHPFFTFTLCMSILYYDILVTLLTKHHVITAERAQTKRGNGVIGYRLIGRNYPSANFQSELRDHHI